MTSKELCDYFQLGASTINGRRKMIRDLLKISPLNADWTLPSRLYNPPLAWMISVDGYITDVRTASREIQEIAYKKG